MNAETSHVRRRRTNVHLASEVAAPHGSQRCAWLGSDIDVAAPVSILPGQHVDLAVNVGALQGKVPHEHLRGLRINGRSVIAQLGAELSLKAGKIVADALNQQDIPQTVTVPIRNLSYAPITIFEGPVGRLMNLHSAHTTGDEFMQLIKSDAIRITGKQHVEWWIHENRDHVPVGIGMMLGPEEWIPPRPDPVDVPNIARGDFRERLAQALQPIGPDDTPRVRIGQTLAILGLDESVMGYIDPSVDTATAPPGVRIGNRRHINARGLFGGSDYVWPIRTEILTSELEKKHAAMDLPPKAIIVTFAKVAA